MAGYKGRHYTPAKYPGTDLWDPSTVNYPLELFKAEVMRLAAGLFGGAYGASRALDLVHLHTDPDWVSSVFGQSEAPKTPSLHMAVRGRFETTVATAVGTRMEIKTQVGGNDAAVTMLHPRVYTWVVELTTVERGEYPPFDLSQKAEELVDDNHLEVYGVGIQSRVETPMAAYWQGNRFGVRMERGAVEYRGVPRWFGDEFVVSSLIQSVSLALMDKTIYDEHEIDEEVT